MARTRKRKLPVPAADLVQRALEFEERDESSRTEEMDIRRQRYAKYRLWREGAARPWSDASDIALPDLMTHSQRVQDTLYNAVMSQYPPLIAKATRRRDQEKEEVINDTIAYQALVENGKQWLDTLIEDFVNDGHFTALVSWVDESRPVDEVSVTGEPIPPEFEPGEYFRALMQRHFARDGFVNAVPRTGSNPLDAWDWTAILEGGEQVDVAFYTDPNDNVEMVVKRMAKVFNGPKIKLYDREDVLHPARAENLQIPSPSNPGGSAHVALRDRVVEDEVARLQKSGFYDELSTKDLKALRERTDMPQESDTTQQKATIEGSDVETRDSVEGHAVYTRLLVFDTIDVDGDGVAEDVVYWVLKETEQLLRVRRLSEVFPSSIPMRPLAESQFLSIAHRRVGIGILEMAEGIHDATKQLLDMSVDLGTMQLSPFWFYRPTSSLNPDIISLFPGEGYPVTDPKNDVFFPQLPNTGQATAFNLLALLDRYEERLLLQGDLQLGRVPQGKSSALRTASGIAMISGMGDARPERLVRRFFGGLAQIWSIMHEMNRHFLPPSKEIRRLKLDSPHKDPYVDVQRENMDAAVEFEFTANAFNTSKQMMQQSLLQLGTYILSPIAFASGTATPQTFYSFVTDVAEAWGLDATKYISSPYGLPLITAEEAVASIMDDVPPIGFPQEGPALHLTSLQVFEQSEEFGLLTEPQLMLYHQWIQLVQQFAVEMQQQQALAARAQEAEGGGQGGQGGGGSAEERNSSAPLQPNELSDETLPTAGGGGNTGAGQ